MLTGLYHSAIGTWDSLWGGGGNRAVLLHTAGRIFQPLITRQVEQGGSYFSQSVARKPRPWISQWKHAQPRTLTNTNGKTLTGGWPIVTLDFNDGNSLEPISMKNRRAPCAIHQWNKFILLRKILPLSGHYYANDIFMRMWSDWFDITT